MQIRPEFLPAALLFVLCIAANIVLYPPVSSMVSGNPQPESKDNFSVKLLQELKSFQNRYIPGSDVKNDSPDKPILENTGIETPDIKQTKETKTLTDRDPFARFINEDEIQNKVAAPVKSKPMENKADAAAKLYDKNIENRTSEKTEPLTKPAPKAEEPTLEPQKESDTDVLPSLTALMPQDSQPSYANQVKWGEPKKATLEKEGKEIVNVSGTVTGKNCIKKLPEWETVDSVLNTPVIYDTPSAVIPFPQIEESK